MKILCSAVIYLIAVFTAVAQKPVESANKDASGNYEDFLIFQLSVSKGDEKRIFNSSGYKVYLKDFSWELNGIPLSVKSCHTRGSTTLYYPRKSFLLNFKKKEMIGGLYISRCALNNLAMDKNYWRNRFSFIIMNDLGIFPLHNQFAELRINDESRGIYLMVEMPDSYSIRKDSPILMRRKENGALKIEYMDSVYDELSKKMRRSVKLMQKYHAEELYRKLNDYIHLNRYFKWLAINYVLMNGDYADEVFFYFDKTSGQFNIIPWDYDDIFSTDPHEGWTERDMKMKNKLIFSCEDKFDYKLDKDEYLYSMYLEEFEKVLDLLTDDYLKAVFKQVYNELYSFYNNKDIIAQSRYDEYGITDLDNLSNDLIQHSAFLSERIRMISRDLELEKQKFK